MCVCRSVSVCVLACACVCVCVCMSAYATSWFELKIKLNTFSELYTSENSYWYGKKLLQRRLIVYWRVVLHCKTWDKVLDSWTNLPGDKIEKTYSFPSDLTPDHRGGSKSFVMCAGWTTRTIPPDEKCLITHKSNGFTS